MFLFSLVLLTSPLFAQNAVTLNGQAVAGIVETLDSSTIAIGGTTQARARYILQDQSSNVKVNCIWSSSNTAVATISATGLVTGVSGGSATITCIPHGPNLLNLTGTAPLVVGNAPIITSPACATPPCALLSQTQNVNVGVSLSPAFAASGGSGTYAWTVSVGSLPTGLSLGDSGCLPTGSTGCNIIGTPTGTGTSTFTIHVQDSASNVATLQVTLTINPTSGPPTQYSARTDVCETGGSGDPGNVQCTSAVTGTLGSPMSYTGKLGILGFGPNAPAPYTTSTVQTVPAMGPSGTPDSHCRSLAQPAGTYPQYLCASLSAPPYSIGYAITDPDFNSTIYRVTDWSLSNNGNTNSTYNCGGKGFGLAFTVGNDGNSHYWSANSDKFIVTQNGGSNAIFKWDPSGHLATMSGVCGANFPGQYAMSMVNDHVIWSLVDDQESSVVGTLTGGGAYGGTFVTWPAGETIKQAGGATSTVLSVTNGLMQIGAITAGSDNGTAWTGQTSGAVFTPTAGTAGLATEYAYVNMLLKGILCDGAGDPVQANCPSSATTTPSTWVMEWQPLFNFNDVHNQAGSPVGNPFFPNETGGVSNCLPYVNNPGGSHVGFKMTYQGVLVPSYDDTSFTIIFGDNGQGGHPGGVCPNSPAQTCTGPVWIENLTVGSGGTSINSMTMRVTSYWGATGQLVEAQYRSLLGTVTGTFQVGETATQATSGAKAQVLAVSYQGNSNKLLVGTPAGSPDSSHTWTGATSGATLASPGAVPASVPFSDYDTIHEASNSANAAYATFGGIQQSNGKITNWQTCKPACGSTTVTFSSVGQYDAGQYAVFFNLRGSAAYADSPFPYFWGTAVPFLITTGTGKNGTTLVIQDASTACNVECTQQSGAVMYPWAVATQGAGSNSSSSYVRAYWQVGTLNVNSCIAASCAGHEAKGYLANYTAKKYAAHDWANSSLPCGITPATPCPSNYESQLFPQNIPGDQHGCYLNSGTTDNTPVCLATTNVAGLGQAGVGAESVAPDTQAYAREIDAAENFIFNGNNAHCKYSGSNPVCSPSGIQNGCVACMYRFAHSWNTSTNWAFNAQNNIGIESPDGKWFLFSFDGGQSFGCMDGSANCWSSYIADGGPGNSTVTTASPVVTTDASSVVTINMQNLLCIPGTFTGSIQSGPIYCGPPGTPAAQITFSGFAESWLNSGTMSLTAVGGCVSPGTNWFSTCNSFTGTVPGAPANYTSGSNTETGAVAKPTFCSGTGTPLPCARTEIGIIDLLSAHY